MVTQETKQVAVKVEVKRKSFISSVKDAPFYPELKLERDQSKFIGVPLILWDATIRDWDDSNYGSSQYVIFKGSVNEPGEEDKYFLFKCGGVAVVSRVKRALARKQLPSREGLTTSLMLQTSENGKAYYSFFDM